MILGTKGFPVEYFRDIVQSPHEILQKRWRFSRPVVEHAKKVVYWTMSFSFRPRLLLALTLIVKKKLEPQS